MRFLYSDSGSVQRRDDKEPGKADSHTIQATVWLERDSLHKLLKQSTHPLMCACVKRLKVGGDRVSPYLWDLEPERSWGSNDRPVVPEDLAQLQEWADGDFEGTMFFFGDSGGVVDESSIIRNSRDAIHRLDFQERMELESLDVHLLSEAFRGLSNLATLVFEYAISSPGSRKLAQSGFVVHDPGIPWRCHVFHVLLQALSKAGVSPQEIIWQNECVNDDEEGLPIWAFNDLTLVIGHEQMIRLLSNLRVLHLEKTWENKRYSKMWFDDVVSDRALGRFIELCPQLEELHLEFGTGFPGLTRESLMGKPSDARLRKLTLKDMQIGMSQLGLCVSTNKFLEKVTLHDITLTTGYWFSFLDLLRADPPPLLQTFKLIEDHPDGGEGTAIVGAEAYDGGWSYTHSDVLDYIQGKTDINPPFVWERTMFEDVLD